MNADGVIHPKEVEYMDKVYAEFDISIDDLEDMADMDIVQADSVICDMSEKKKNYAKLLFFFMAEADGFVHPLEAALSEQIFKMN